MSKKKFWKKNTGGGFALPIRRRYEREALEQKPEHKEVAELPSRNEEIRLKLVQDLPRMEAFIEECDRKIALNELKNDEARLSQAEALNVRAGALMQERGIDYHAALRLTAQEQEADEPTVEQVEAYAVENEMDFSTALRSMLHDRRVEAQALGSVRTGSVNVEQENREMEKAMKERGYDV